MGRRKPFIDLSKKIIEFKMASRKTSSLEVELDLLFYKLYELTPTEIKIVEAN